MKIGLIGYGSIGRRHIKNLHSLGYKNIILLRRKTSGNDYNLKEFDNFDLFLDQEPSIVIISNPSSLHYYYLSKLIDLDKNIIVEKPIVTSSNDFDSLKEKLKYYKGKCFVALNMRFHPCIKELTLMLNNNEVGKILYSRFCVGQYLPDWREKKDYTKVYSSKKELGGGVLLDLIHEIDLACFLIGNQATRIKYLVSKVSRLKINCEDIAEIIYQTSDDCLVNIHLDYLSMKINRYIEIIGEKGNIKVDLINNYITKTDPHGNSSKKEFLNFNRNDMYYDMISEFLYNFKNNLNSKNSLIDCMKSNEMSIKIREDYYNENKT